MQGIIVKWLINALSLLLVGYLLPGFRVESFFSALVAALFLGVLNAIVRPILVVLTLPLTVLTLGFFILVINGLMLYILDGVIKGIHIDSFWSAFLGALILSAIGWLTNSFAYTRGGIHYIDLKKNSDGTWR